MTNTWQYTTDFVAKEALRLMRSNTVAFQLMHNPKHEAKFSGDEKIGDKFKVKVPPEVEIKTFDGTATKSDLEEGTVDVEVEKHYYVKLGFTTFESTFEMENYSKQVIEPVAVAFAEKVDQYCLGKFRDIPNYAGTAGTPPDSIADFAALNRKLRDQRAKRFPINAVIGSDAEQTMLSLAEFVEADKKGDTEALREARIGRWYGQDWHVAENIGLFTAGTASGDVPAVNGAVAEGATTFSLDGMTAGATLKYGDLFEISGVQGQFVVSRVKDGNGDWVEEFTADGGGAAVDIPFFPAAPAGGIPDNATLDVVGDHTKSCSFADNAFTAFAVTPKVAKGASASSVASHGGLAIRVTKDWDSTALEDIVVFDIYLGAQRLDPSLAVVSLG